MPAWYRLLRAAPEIGRILGSLDGARKGDQQAIAYLRSEAIGDIAETWREGGRAASKHAWQAVKEVIRPDGTPGYIDAEYRVLDGAPPFEGFARWLKAQRWGTFVLLGPKNSGKTTLAMRLGQLWHQETGWPVESVMAYPDDRYPFVTSLSTNRFTGRMKAIIALLNPPEPTKGSKEEVLDTDEIEARLEGFKRRIVIIDEASLVVGSSGVDAGRQMVRQIMAQARHLEWLICYCGQLAKMLPGDLLNCEAIFVKEPTGREMDVDRDDRLTRDLWTRATEAFKDVHKSPWWRDFPDKRSWSYVDCIARDWRGLVPSRVPQVDSELEPAPAEEV